MVSEGRAYFEHAQEQMKDVLDKADEIEQKTGVALKAEVEEFINMSYEEFEAIPDDADSVLVTLAKKMERARTALSLNEKIH